MSFATANRTSLWAVKETVWGTTPNNPAFKPLRYTGEQLDDNISTEKSKEIRSDRMVTDLIVVDSSPSGSFNFEMSASSFEDLIESALMSAWSAQLAITGAAGDISTLAASSDNLTSTTAGKFTNVVVGQWIRLRGFTATVNGYYQVTAKTDNQTLTLFPQPGAAETPALAAAKIDGSYIRNGVTETSYTLMKILNDATAVTRQVFTGMRVKGFSLDMQTGAILTGSFDFVGKSGSWTESTFAGETFAAATTTEVMNCVTNIKNIVQDGSAMGGPGSIMQLSMEFDNQHREQKGIGVLGNVGVVGGTLMVNCSASQYFESKAQADKFKNSTAFAFSYRIEDKDENSYIITLPRCKYESFVVNSSQLDSDVMAETQFTALRDPTTNCMIQVDRFADYTP